MATVLDATYGGSAANTYITLADADAYIRDYLDEAEAWERIAGVGNKQALALLAATRQIDAAAAWHGGRYFWNQRLEFPRAVGVVDIGNRAIPDAIFESLTLSNEYLRQQKERVRIACCIQAVYRLAEGRDTAREEQYRGVTSSSRGHRWSESLGYGRPHLVLCPEAWDQLAPYEGDPVIKRGGTGGYPPGRTPIVGGLP